MVTGNNNDFKALVKQNWKLREKNCDTEECLLNWYKRSTELYRQIAEKGTKKDAKSSPSKRNQKFDEYGLPIPNNKVAFNNFSKVVADILSDINRRSKRSKAENYSFSDVEGPYSALQLYSEYKQNELVANKKYKGKKIRVTGTTESVTEDFIGNAIVKTESPSFVLGGAMFNVDKNDPYILDLVPGSKVDMVCVGGGFIMDSPVLRKCVSTESYSDKQSDGNHNTMITGVADAIAYIAYMFSEDILEKMCVSATNCSKLKTLFYGLMKEKKTDNDIKILREMLVDMGLNADSFMQDLEQAHERFQAFIKQYKQPLEKKYDKK
ncbi:putative nucleic acid binding protein [Xenorhabdus cabanillasii]|uniref:Putative nucleic acid binding protein n=1 Tax=Xenorhabdus cabanillasii TaxID=351673 RepID=A0A3D9UH62_9GAMM|nr:OB-fold putative lipoprotein [Xenorhabdus cabanillasii]REF28679.1 putative nucleic acid binding protein [Xenorhabdus cabanillasii]